MLNCERHKGFNLYFCDRVALLLQLVIYEERKFGSVWNVLLGHSLRIELCSCKNY